ncbi:MAG: 2-amino-4-hydroxy-6-hydroxymethyldihydropteridine diphosphokinase [Maritimibacter sp.]
MAQVLTHQNTHFSYIIALGSNATSDGATPRQIIEKALNILDVAPLRLVAASGLYLTPFMPIGTGEDVVNAVALVETELGPAAVMDNLHKIESNFGRARVQRWGSRTLDLDLIMAGEQVIPSAEVVQSWMDRDPDAQKEKAPDQLLLPHPRLQDRAFVLVPAMDVAPDWRHPLLGRTLRELHDALPKDELAAITPLV